ncbi:FkbM family methyltransferase [Belnapia moabensis]|uniref:FkbM family methyltransferase n=1 Tax=Belnapia moabensis TaxID=365533 RepID=UPI000693ADD1|nr:FkbM family methyltransferase [Belnapia moabensis]
MSQGQTAAPSNSPLLRVAEWLRPRRRLVPVARLAGPAGPAEAAVRALAQAVPMAGETLLCRTLGRHKMLVDAGDFTHAPHLAVDGFWEWWTTRFLAERLKPGQVFVDGGACYGYFSLLAAELVGPAGKVLAFEPHPRSAVLLRRNLALNGMEGRSQVEEVALAGPESGRVMRFVLPEGSPMNAHLLPEELAGGGGGPGMVRGPGIAMVATRALDRHGRVKPDVVKLDLCGAEEAAFAGMQGVIEANPAVQVLLCFNPVRSAAPADFLGRLAGQFRLRRLTARGEAQDCTPAEAMSGGDVMLYLAR